ncbi:hypothetical protein B0H13DRAFT_1994106 [Mycena leptocephala]|nr:hypothetical protein B0H13DRAFT_2138296 [Mycena leptocephala]KAJ7899370.1 hypothetical protein B0H13DRAFT_2030922 [Mycena leptocephala]KAJ7918050.1 hypothetical protein B0H13DRAFT_1994106 [Mycena leptocephala]
MDIRTFFLPPHTRLALLITLIQITLSIGTTFERTIDDTFGDSESGLLPIYTPAKNFSPNSNCTSCVLRTWHDGSQLSGGPAVSVTLSFNGTAITVFCILANTASEGLTTSDFAITLDGTAQKPFTHRPDNTSDFKYHSTVFNVDGLNRGVHHVVITTDNAAGSLFMFDYASYTFDDGVSPSPSVTTVSITNTVVSTSTAPAESTRRSFHHSASSTGQTSNAASMLWSPSSLFPSPPSASSTSLTVQATTSNKRVNLAPILAGTLIPVVLLALAGTILCRRQRARYAKELESTRVHLPEPEWVQFYDRELPESPRVPGPAQDHQPEKMSRNDEGYPPAQASSSSAIVADAGLSRAPTFRTLASPPPHYVSDFQQQHLLKLLRGDNLPVRS